jgi:hypothetical protein
MGMTHDLKGWAGDPTPLWLPVPTLDFVLVPSPFPLRSLQYSHYACAELADAVDFMSSDEAMWMCKGCVRIKLLTAAEEAKEEVDTLCTVGPTRLYVMHMLRSLVPSVSLCVGRCSCFSFLLFLPCASRSTALSVVAGLRAWCARGVLTTAACNATRAAR